MNSTEISHSPGHASANPLRPIRNPSIRQRPSKPLILYLPRSITHTRTHTHTHAQSPKPISSTAPPKTQKSSPLKLEPPPRLPRHKKATTIEFLRGHEKKESYPVLATRSNKPLDVNESSSGEEKKRTRGRTLAVHSPRPE